MQCLRINQPAGGWFIIKHCIKVNEHISSVWELLDSNPNTKKKENTRKKGEKKNQRQMTKY